MRFNRRFKLTIFDWLNFTKSPKKQFHFGILTEVQEFNEEAHLLKIKKFSINKLEEMAQYFNCQPVEIGLKLKEHKWQFNIESEEVNFFHCWLDKCDATYIINTEEGKMLVLDNAQVYYSKK